MYRGTVAFDIDGVLADFELAFCKTFGHENRHLYNLEERYPTKADEITKFTKNPQIYYGLNVIESGLQFLREFLEKDYGVVIATSRPPASETITRRWLNNNGIPYMRLIYTKSKAVDLQLLGQELPLLQTSILVDDSPTVLEECVEHCINPLCWKQPWNEYFFPKVWGENGVTVFQDHNETSDVVNYWKE